jgi:hypothetical protein
MSLQGDIKFQKTLALAASASNEFEAEAAELAARRVMVAYNIDPTDIPDRSLYSRTKFTDNALLKRLRDEWREEHPADPSPKEIDEPPSRSALSFECNITAFRQANRLREKERKRASGRKRKHANRRKYASRDEARVERLRQLLNIKERPDICRDDGYNQGEISGIIRDCTGAKSADRKFQDNPRWISRLKDGRVVYDRAPERKGHGFEQDSPPDDASTHPMEAGERNAL